MSRAAATSPHRPVRVASTAVLALLLAGGAVPPPAAARLADFALGTHRLQGLRPDLAALLLTGRDGGSVELAVLAVPLEAAGQTVPVSLFVEVDGTSLLGPQPAARPRFDLYAYLLDADAGVRGFLGQGIELDLEEMGEAIYGGGVKFVGGFELPPGSYSLRLLVTEPASQRWGVRVLSLELPSPPPAEAAGAGSIAPRIVAPPIFAEPPGWWVLAGEAPTPERPAGGIAAVVASAAPLPAARPVFAAGRAVAFELLASGLPATELSLDAAAIGGDGRRHQLTARLLGRDAAGAPGRERLRAAVAADDLDPGRYRFEVTIAATGGLKAPAPPLDVVVAATTAEGEPAAPTWASLGPTAAGAGAVAATPGANVPSPRRRRRGGAAARALRTLAASYRGALGRAATGEDASGAMTSFERQAVTAAGSDPGIVAEAEMQLLSDLAGVDPEALVPAIVLHLDLYASYLADREFFLAVHSRNLVEGIAELYARTAAGGGGRALASRALTRLGVSLEQAQLMARARALLTRAVDLDPHDSTALLALAAGYEKLGEYAEAVTYLRRLVEVDPKAAEGRLRLAINLDRTGDRGDAGALLRRLLAEDNPRWILSLAYQQLARQRFDAGDPAAAARLLATAVDRLPGDERLAIALAYARDRAGDPAAARDAIARVVAGGGSAGPSPRLRYNEWPEEAAARSAEILRRNARARLAALAAALEDLGEGDLRR